MRSYVCNGVYRCKISPTSFDPCNISIFIAYFRPKLYCHSFIAKTEITTGTSIKLPIGKEFCSYRYIPMQNITHFSWIKQHKTFVGDELCCLIQLKWVLVCIGMHRYEQNSLPIGIFIDVVETTLRICFDISPKMAHSIVNAKLWEGK